MDWSRQATKNELVEHINGSASCVKVLAAEGLKFKSAKTQCEGVFVFRIDGDAENGIGFLLSNIESIDFPAIRGDLVQYRTIRTGEKPYITTVASGATN